MRRVRLAAPVTVLARAFGEWAPAVADRVNVLDGELVGVHVRGVGMLLPGDVVVIEY